MKPYDASHFDHECCRPVLHAGGEKGILLIHGFTGCVSHMRPLGDALADRGYTVMGINLPGHALTEEEMGQTGWSQWLQASRDALAKLRRQCDRVAVAGLSMGGDIALILAEEGLTDACAAISAPMATRNRWIHAAPFAAPFKPRVSWAPPTERHQKLDPAFDYGYSGFPTRKLIDLEYLMRKARRHLTRVRCPLLAVQSTGDRTVWPGSLDCMMRGVSSERKQELALKDVPHVCTLSDELPAIVDAVDRLVASL